VSTVGVRWCAVVGLQGQVDVPAVVRRAVRPHRRRALRVHGLHARVSIYGVRSSDESHVGFLSVAASTETRRAPNHQVEERRRAKYLMTSLTELTAPRRSTLYRDVLDTSWRRRCRRSTRRPRRRAPRRGPTSIQWRRCLTTRADIIDEECRHSNKNAAAAVRVRASTPSPERKTTAATDAPTPRDGPSRTAYHTATSRVNPPASTSIPRTSSRPNSSAPKYRTRTKRNPW
jgi:hypothetical protein